MLLTLELALLLGCSRTEPARPSSPPQPAVNVPPPPPPPPPAETAGNGAKEGRGGRGREGPLATAVGADRHAVASYFCRPRAAGLRHSNPRGHETLQGHRRPVPKSHEEFMERIIKENHINLPQLPEGHRYVYDPKRGS